MHLRQHWLYFWKTYSYIGDYITDIRCEQKKLIVYVSPEQLSDYGFVIEHDIILLPCIHEPHRDSFHHPFNSDSSNLQADSKNLFIDQE